MEPGKIYQYTYKDSGRAVYYDGEESTARAIEKLVQNIDVEYIPETQDMLAYKLDCLGHRVSMRRIAKDSYLVIPRHQTSHPFIVIEKARFEKSLISDPVEE